MPLIPANFTAVVTFRCGQVSLLASKLDTASGFYSVKIIMDFFICHNSIIRITGFTESHGHRGPPAPSQRKEMMERERERQRDEIRLTFMQNHFRFV